jgi:hypothetical protein
MYLCKSDWGDSLEQLNDEEFDQLLEHAEDCSFHAKQVDEYVAEITPLLRAASTDTAVSANGVRPVRRLGLIDYWSCWYLNLLVKVHPTIMRGIQIGFRNCISTQQMATGIAICILGLTALTFGSLVAYNAVRSLIGVEVVSVQPTQVEPSPQTFDSSKQEELARWKSANVGGIAEAVNDQPRALPVKTIDQSKKNVLTNNEKVNVSIEVSSSGYEVIENDSADAQLVVLVAKESIYVKKPKPDTVDNNYATFKVTIAAKGATPPDVLCTVQLKKNSAEGLTLTPEAGFCSFSLKVSEEYELTVNAKGYQPYKKTFLVQQTGEQNEAANLEATQRKANRF